MDNQDTKEIYSIEKNEMPLKLRQIPQSPSKLYIKGHLPPEEYVYICIVGSRKYTEYGKAACEKIIEGLKGFPIVIVSGLAYGIDAIAHEAALQSELITIAFPGSGLNNSVLYPRAHTELAQRIIDKGGALVSEYESDFKAMPWAFPQRNRLMAGISDAALIIEADIRSGTLITARLATEYNRDVFAVPGSIFSSTSEGPHMLIQQGAMPVTCATDILLALGFETEKPDSEENKKNNEKDNHSQNLNLSSSEKEVLNALSYPMNKENLCDGLHLSAIEINITLSQLELKGLIAESGQEWRRK